MSSLNIYFSLSYGFYTFVHDMRGGGGGGVVNGAHNLLINSLYLSK